jgi:transposase
MKLAYVLLDGLANAYVAGDRAYDARPLLERLEANGCTALIHSNTKHLKRGQAPRKIDQHLYKERHLVECFFQRIKRFRRIAMRFDKLARNFLGFLHLAAALVWLV